MPYCTNCGEEYSEGQRFCTNCGEPVGGGPSERDSGQDPADRWHQSAGDDGTEQTAAGDEWGQGDGWREEPGGWEQDRPSGGRRPRRRRRGPPRERRRRPPDRPEIPRKNAVDTIVQSSKWLIGFPVLIVIFVAANLISPISAVGGPILQLVISILGGLATTFATGMGIVYAEHAVREEPVDVTAAARRVGSRFLALIGVFIVYGLAVGVGLLMIVVPGLYIGARLYPALPATVLDEYSISDSLSIGWEIGEGNVWKLLGIFVLTNLVTTAVTVIDIARNGFQTNPDPVLLLVVSPIGAIFSAISALALARVYVENY